MDIKAHFKDKLSKLLFLEMKKERVESIFNTKFEENEEIYMPIATEDIINKVKEGKNVESIPIAFFVEGMIYVLGADEGFRFNNIYKKLINSIPKSSEFIKGKIAEKVKSKKYEEAYIMLKGFLQIDKSKEVFDKLIMLSDNLRASSDMYLEEELEIIDKAKSIEGYALPYLYEAMIERDKGDYYGALFSINNYISRGGEETAEILEFKESLKIINEYDKAKKLVYEEPKEALKILLPMLDQLGDSAEIYYYIAIAYRVLKNFEKAIYYLQSSLEIDNSYPEVFNEMGINYASLGDFETAVKYLRKVFEATKSIEVCTNLIMCYINMGDYKQAKLHLEIAKKINKDDEIVKELEVMLNNV
ncbi:tetratricopeptide repeat protein [Clostridium thermopalmarium]|jgi:tetratricopeptide (TPR) repeat protein|uniref:Tetratricopeptide repeat protein n=1 Tax=Clostridium thermopalmarium DSM 5974 TaxID=1121340 RepID=A0A2T0AXD5_9CLOT|nr:tetratricopeptide repeat protein [Clostridium thermopalmarium]MBE6044608.1 tetratricopeptide repeat protein [Clostridium thermopalmarium]PRR75470.1 Tetratricopeptide repeat protein [Clostridium thermopalmarium DSM 5974]PVZ24372.1 Flp pilus assembly protein TadD [Clostridium thermopalmarium DSM 5974]